MSEIPTPDYTSNAVGRRFPRCRGHDVHTVRAVRQCPEGADGWGLLCPGPPGGRPHLIPVREPAPEVYDRFPPCRLCGVMPGALRPNLDDEGVLVSFTFAGCGHTVAVSAWAALGLH